MNFRKNVSSVGAFIQFYCSFFSGVRDSGGSFTSRLCVCKMRFLFMMRRSNREKSRREKGLFHGFDVDSCG